MRKAFHFLTKWILIFLIASIVIFAVVRMMPTDPVEHYLFSMNLPLTDENIESITRMMRLDRPLLEQYCTWMLDFVQGNWGTTLVSRLDIREQFFQKAPYSIAIGFFGLLISAVSSFFLGYRAAVRRGGICDRLSSLLVILTQSVPSFIAAILVINLLSVKLKLMKFFTGSGLPAIISAILITAIYTMGTLTRVVKDAFCEEMTQSYVRFSISRGFSKEKVLFCHARRPVICRLISAIISNFATILGGSSVLEFAFTIPGISFFLISSMQKRDYNVMQSYVLFMVLWMFIVHLVLNIVLALLDVRRKK